MIVHFKLHFSLHYLEKIKSIFLVISTRNNKTRQLSHRQNVLLRAFILLEGLSIKLQSVLRIGIAFLDYVFKLDRFPIVELNVAYTDANHPSSKALQ